MTNNIPLFSNKYLQKHCKNFQIANLDAKLKIVHAWQNSIYNNAVNISKEESLKADFIRDFFASLLDYSSAKDTGEWTLEYEQKTAIDSTKSDSALGYFSIAQHSIIADVRVVIELKNAKTKLDKAQNRKNDKRTPVQQAFDYANATSGLCRWVIVSNFLEIRLYYQTDRTRYQPFNILELDNIDNFKAFYYLLCKAHLIHKTSDSITDKLYNEQQVREKEITKEFYRDYKKARHEFFYDLKSLNPSQNNLVLLAKTQKLLDRLLFILFCEDRNIIDNNTLRQLIKNTKADKFDRDKSKIYKRLCVLFDDINHGYDGYEDLKINKFNGGLFAEDLVFNSLRIDDEHLTNILSLVDYDFDSDLNVNILGHIFEQSISDLEEFKASINGDNFDKKQGKRKKDGIYYTPDNITRYIVDEAIGAWLHDRRVELNEEAVFNENNTQSLLSFYSAYKEYLRNIRVLDPACGSGAFLNQAFDFLQLEWQRVNNELADLGFKENDINALDLNKQILENNLFGVDLNDESVEITKLSLWLKTANRYKELSSLDNNIKCGNSLCDDANIAGNKAFVWQNEFKDIMANGGFDVIIGNPPYVFARNKGFSQKEKLFFQKKYQLVQYQINSFILFIEQCYHLISVNGRVGLIIPNNWLTIDTNSDLRKFILYNMAKVKIINIFNDVFDDANVNTCLFLFEKAIDDVMSFATLKNSESKLITFESISKSKILAPKFYFKTSSFQKSNVDELLIKITQYQHELSSFLSIKSGVKVYEVGKGIPAQTIAIKNTRAYHSKKENGVNWFKYLNGCDVLRYAIHWTGEYVLYGDNMAGKRQEFYFESPRILVRQIPNNPPYCVHAVYCEDKYINDMNSMIILSADNQINLKYILAILNSKLISFWFVYFFDKLQRKTFPQFKIVELKEFPILIAKQHIQQIFIEKVDIELEQNKRLQALQINFLKFIQTEFNLKKLSTKLQQYQQLSWEEFKNELAKAKINVSERFDLKALRQWQSEFEEEKQKALAIKTIIEQTDKEIDNLVYTLYGLNTAEIALIENDSI